MPINDARYYKTLLICPNRQMGTEISPLLATALPLAPVQDISAYPNRKQLVELTRSFEPKLCLLDFSSDPERAFNVLSEFSSIGAALPLIALLGNNNPDLILRCLRQGAAEFLIRPFTGDQLDAAFEKIVRLYPPPTSKRSSNSKVIAVVPCKGASGATTIACNLAHQSKRLGSAKTLLADLDPLTGTVSFLLKVKSSYSFLDILSRRDQLDADLWKQLITTSHGIDVLLPPEHLVEGLDELPESTPVILSAQEIYDTVVLDCGTPFGLWNLSAAEACDELVLVTTNELASLQSSQRILAYYDHANIDISKVKLVVNRYHREVGLRSDAIGSALDAEVFHTIPSDYDSIQKSILEGKPVAANTVFGKSVAALAERLVAAQKQNDPDKVNGNARERFSLFSRS